MRLPRSRFETACRVGVFALIGWLLGTSLIPSAGRRVERATSETLESKLADWARLASTVTLHADLTTTPAGWAIDWLSALRRSGHVVTWNGSPPAGAMSAEALADPAGSARIDVAGPPGLRVRLRDDASVIDSVRVANLGGSVTTPIVVGDVVASAGGDTMRTASPEALAVRSIVVVGGAGWEG